MFAELFTMCVLVAGALSQTCSPVTCPPGFEITRCTMDGERFKCEPCPAFKVQPLNVSSTDKDILHHCFGVPIEKNKNCRYKLEGVINSRWRDDSDHCGMPCECDVANCYAGPTACDCTKYKPCDVDHQMNATTGECQPCPPQTEKKERGCYPCQHVYMRSTDDQDTSKPPQQQFQLGSHVSEVNKTRDVTHELDATSTLIYDRVIKEEPVEVESILCIPRNAAIIVGSLVILVICVAVFIVFKCRRHHRQPKTSDYNDDSQKEKIHKVTIIQKNSLLFDMEHSETNVSKTPKAACNGSDDTSHKRKPLDLRGKTMDTRLIPEAQDSGYSTTQSTVAPTAVLISKDTVYSSENNCNNSPAGTSLCLRNGTSSPTEHDEESTQLKYCP